MQGNCTCIRESHWGKVSENGISREIYLETVHSLKLHLCNKAMRHLRKVIVEKDKDGWVLRYCDGVVGN
jgi:hypothetical protein